MACDHIITLPRVQRATLDEGLPFRLSLSFSWVLSFSFSTHKHIHRQASKAGCLLFHSPQCLPQEKPLILI